MDEFTKCTCCKNLYEIDFMEEVDNKRVCEDCANDSSIVFTCIECEEKSLEEDFFCKIGGELVCFECSSSQRGMSLNNFYMTSY